MARVDCCVQCGKGFQQPTGRGSRRTKCFDCSPYRKRARPPRPVLSKSCDWCGSTFETRLSVQRYCSPRCANRKRDSVPRGSKCRDCGKQMWHGGRISLPAGKARCRQCRRKPCGTVAAYNRGCRCVGCRSAKAEATRNYLPPAFKHHWIAPADRIAIYERDDWTCQLCGKPVDLTVHHLHRDAPSLDHIEPQSHALIPNHAPSNLRTAHRGCNAARGNRVTARSAEDAPPPHRGNHRRRRRSGA